jgi:hypothetical protein
MGYKFLGFAVWQGVKWYLRRRVPGAGRNTVIAALVGGVVLGGVAVARAVRSGDE